MKIADLSKLITTHPDYDEEFSKNLLTIIVEERKLPEQEFEKKGKASSREFQLEKLQLENERLKGLTSNPEAKFKCRNCGGGDRGRVAIYRPFGEFLRAKIALSPVWCSRPTTGVPLAHATMNFVGLDLTTSDRTAFTKAVNHLQEVIENDPVDKNAVETALEMLDAKSVKLKIIDEDILELMIETNCTEEAYNIEFEAIDGYTEKMIAWQVRVKNIMKTDALGQKDNHSLITSSSSSLRLPKIQFQQFSGELTDWLRFHNQFKRIHEDESIDDGDKFQYLIQATTPKSRARDIVESFPATLKNYRKAFEYLRMRLGQEDVLIQVYIEAQLRALESLGFTKEKYAAMLFPLVESCLRAEILRAWERYVGYSSDESGKKDLDSLMKFLSIEVSSEDRIKLARNSFDSEKSNFKKKLGNLSTTAIAADLFNSNFKNRKDFKFKNNNNNCIFCEKTHASENCEAASMLYEVKKNIVIKRGVCYICLKKGHMSHSCRSDVKRIICNKRHYAVLCSKLSLRSGLETESASIENSTTASSSSSNVLANQACTSEVLLQTLVVMLQNGNHKSLVRALIDTGSQKSYILKSTAENLGFKYEGEEEFVHSLFGGSKTK
ncbi:integrase catalytic domain-containing protein, partial [Trichonephila clavipes]